MTSKLYSRRRLLRLVRRWKRLKQRIVFTNGCFDFLHAGHVDYLARAKRLGDVLVVGLNSDRSVRRIKGPGRPINSERDRAEVLSALACVDSVVVFHESDPGPVIRQIKPDVLAKGADWPLHAIVGARDVLGWGGTVRRVRLLKGRSTTKMLNKMAHAKKTAAAHRR